MDSITSGNSTDTEVGIYPLGEFLDEPRDLSTAKSSLIIREVLGSASLLFWSIQLLPQVIRNYRNGSTVGLSAWMLVLWSLEACLSGAYLIVQKLAISLTIQSELFLLFSLFCSVPMLLLFKRPLINAMALFIAMALLAALLQIGVIFGIQNVLGNEPSSSKNSYYWILQVLGILPVALSILGFIPQYIEVFKLQNSYGLSKCFLFLDMQGAVFALGCLAFHQKFDILAAANIASILVLDIGLIIICLMFYSRSPRRYEIKKTPDANLTIDCEDRFNSDKLSITTVEWWPTTHELEDECDTRKDGIMQELGALRKKMSVKRKCSTSSSYAGTLYTPSQQVITMVTIPLARAHTMNMDFVTSQPNITMSPPPRPQTPLIIPELKE